MLTKTVNRTNVYHVSVIGQRLKCVRDGKGLSLREFARDFDEDFTLIFRIEHGQRYPPKKSVEKFAKALSLTPSQLDALISVERRGLNPHELLPEIPPAHIPQRSIEHEAERVLKKYCRAVTQNGVKLPVPIEEVLDYGCGLSTEYRDFTKKRMPTSHRGLFGCLYPQGFEGKDHVVLVNTGRIGRRYLSLEEQRTTAAHEAGHYVLHCGNKESAQLFFRFSRGPTFCREAECEESLLDPREYQASEFAACLLMPREPFLTAWKSFSGSTARLAECFRVTESFARFRAMMLAVNNNS